MRADVGQTAGVTREAAGLEERVQEPREGLTDRLVDYLEGFGESYFRPRSGEGRLYEALGVRSFRRAVLFTTGSLHRLFRLSRLGLKNYFLDGGSYRDVKRFETWTRINEGTHLLLAPVFLSSCALSAVHGNLGAAVAYGVSAMVNQWCIFLQRYNRTRLYRLMDRMARKG